MAEIVNNLPPVNIEAEEAILGGILLDPEAMARVADSLVTKAFSLEAHQQIYHAAQVLHFQGKLTDLMGVSTYLADHNLLEKIGGTTKLAQLLNRTVSAVNIDRYTALVMDKYARRQLIYAGHEIVDLGYDTTKDLETVLDESEQKIFKLTQERPQEGLVPISDTIINAFNTIEELHQETVLPGVPSGFYDLDAITSGFGRSDLIIVAGRPAMGKTSFCLGIAANIAKQQKLPVAIFSLEMSREQLAQRLLASEAKIASNRLRSGRLSQNEFEPLVNAVGTLSELPIYMDDTANLSILQMRSQVRRLQGQTKQELGLVLLDYLQLMEGSGSDNRVQELSKMTRSLKGLARELNVPIIALSQLSRGVEQRNNKRPMLSDLRESGCLTGDSLITLADTGLQVSIKKLAGLSGFSVWALNQNTQKIEKALVSNAFCTGIKSVFTIKTALGRTIEATANHKFLTIKGWKRLDELTEGDYIATPKYLPDSYKQTMTDVELGLLDRSIGDGCTLPRHAIQYTTKERDLGDLVISLSDRVFGDLIKPRIKKENQLMVESNITTRRIQFDLGISYYGTSIARQNASHCRANKLANIVRSQELHNLANSDIYWDTIKSIEFSGEKEVYDLTVPIHHNFVANNIVVHNSIEQDADLVIMYYYIVSDKIVMYIIIPTLPIEE